MLARYSNLPETVKAISIRQPYASAIVRGFKPIENRTWQTSYRGPLLIHAAAGREVAPTLPATRAELDRVSGRLGRRPRGAIVGIATLIDIRRVSACDDPWAVGPWCWVLSDAVEFAEPIWWKGKLSLFEVGREVFGSTLNSSTYPSRAEPSTAQLPCQQPLFAGNVLA